MSDVIIYKGDTPTLKRQIKKNNNPVNLSGSTIKFGIKQAVGDGAYLVGPKDCSIIDEQDGKFSVTLTTTDTTATFSDAIGEFEWTDPLGNILTIEQFTITCKDIVIV